MNAQTMFADVPTRPPGLSGPPFWSADADADVLEPRVTASRFPRDTEIVAQGEPATYCYLVTTGCARTVRVLADGRRQIGEFLFPGDLFGWEALDRHDFGVEAVTNITVHRFNHNGLDNLVAHDDAFARRLRQLAASQVRYGRKHMMLLGRNTATERVANFILEIGDRMKLDGRTRVPLPMSRGDMADYLGVTHETVCRQLTRLRVMGAIVIESAKIVLFDRKLLEAAINGR